MRLAVIRRRKKYEQFDGGLTINFTLNTAVCELFLVFAWMYVFLTKCVNTFQKLGKSIEKISTDNRK